MAIKHPRVGRILFLYSLEFGTEVCDPISDFSASTDRWSSGRTFGHSFPVIGVILETWDEFCKAYTSLELLREEIALVEE